MGEIKLFLPKGHIRDTQNSQVEALLVSLNQNGTLKGITLDDKISSGYFRLNDLQICWGRITLAFSNETWKAGTITLPVAFKDINWQLITSMYNSGLSGDFVVQEYLAHAVQLAYVRAFDSQGAFRTGTVYVTYIAIGVWK